MVPGGFCLFRVLRGGKGALGPRAAGDAQGGNEADAVWVAAGVGGGISHQGSDGVVAVEVPPDFLQDQVGDLDRSTALGPRWWVLSSSKVFSISHRCE